jgi:hypothetical protein
MLKAFMQYMLGGGAGIASIARGQSVVLGKLHDISAFREVYVKQ